MLQQRLTYLRSLDFQPQVILDIGAFEGDWSVLVQKIWPNATIFMVEANQDCESKLKNIKGVLGYAIALLGDKSANNVKFYKTSSTIPTGNSIYRENSSYFVDANVVNLPMVTLDQLVQAGRLNQPNLIKIDAQGSELDILKGGSDTVRGAEFIVIETQVLEYNQGAPDIQQAMAYMKSIGFQLFDLLDAVYVPSGELAQLDLLFVREGSKFIKTGQLL